METLNTPDLITYQPPVYPNEFEGLKGAEIEPFTDTQEAAKWLMDTIPSISRVEKPWRQSEPETIPDGLTEEEASSLKAGGIEASYRPNLFEVGHNTYEVLLTDLAGGTYRITGGEDIDQQTKKTLSETLIEYSTPTSSDGKSYRTLIWRKSNNKAQRKQHNIGKLSYWSARNVDTELEIVKDPESFRDGTKFEELKSDEEVQAAEATFLQLTSAFRQALESKLAIEMPEKLEEIEDKELARKLEKQGRIRQFMGRIASRG